MMSFKYCRPETVAEACAMLERYAGKAKILAGGTDLNVLIRDEDKRIANMKYVIDITFLKELRFIKETETSVVIGTLETHGGIGSSETIKELFPFLGKACMTVGSPQIRHMGTIGGNIANASPAADGIVPLVALDAQATVVSSAGERTVPLASLFEKPYVSAVKPDELITQIVIPKLPESAKTVFLKLARRKSLAISRMNIAVAIAAAEDGRVTYARIAPGCIFPVPMRVTAAEAVLIGKKPSESDIKEAARKVSEAMIEKTGVRWSTEYKKPVIEAFTERAVTQALGRCR